MPKYIITTLLLLFISQVSYATHNRAGEITFEHVEGTSFTYKVVVYTYTKASSVAADRDSLEVFWGDGTSDTLARSNGGGNGVNIGNDIKKNEYTGTHVYPGLGTFVISMADPNRIAGIKNINGGNSVDEPFYIEDSLKILDPAFFGYNSSPILLNPPIDFGNTFITYIHNPNAYDPDGDSLSFEFITPRKAALFPVTNYVDPNKVIGTPPENTFTINGETGEVIWSTPVFTGTYNFAILIREYRSGTCIGTMVRDMEVIVDSTDNLPPVIATIFDTCIVAGTTLVLKVSASDPNLNQTVKLTSNGGPFEVATSPATFTSSSGVNNVTGTFTWNTSCDHVRLQFYQVIFKAEDSYVTPLVDIKNWLITVVAPAPENVLAVSAGNNIQVSWKDPYTCYTTENFIGFSVWRKEESNPFAIDTCETGLDGKGYTKIAERILEYQYLDQNVDLGKQYCYRVLAEFADKALSQNIPIYYNNVNSLPSNESCAQLAKTVPVITNVSVTETNANTGKMFVAWSKPSAIDLDTLQHPGPYKYVIWRSTGFPGGAMVRIDSIEAISFTALVDTFINDEGLNTQDNAYSYKLTFFSNGIYVGETDAASSIFITTKGSDKNISLTWKVVVPWTNDYYVIYRKNAIGVFDSIGLSFVNSYFDAGLVNLVQQCYVIKSVGSYSAPGFVDPIINFSQEKCDVPIDSVAPCTPLLEVKNLCNTTDFSQEGFVNELIWSYADVSCAADVIKYYIYYTSIGGTPYQLIDSVTNLTSNTYLHQLNNNIAGCYYLTVQDSNLNVSGPSNIVCVENCPIYMLPNVFTPNGDGHNDTYHPFLPIQFVDRIDIKIFSQWGDLVFESTDPMIGWDGKNQQSGKDSPESTYYYVCDVYSGQQIAMPTLSGYIHLFR
ncbi:MAG: gliding motility-associated C-terminal domain-containing protein [Chitinophagales bacterium]|nr:gliding motility-associated C-terminal domain-containing protein [Chitinophagales bacterium]